MNLDTTSLTDLSADTLAAAYRSGELSPVEVTEASLARIDEYDSRVNAFFTLTPEIARSEARAAEKRFLDKAPIGPMDGVPYSIKDLDATAGIASSFGSPDFKGVVPDYSSVVAERLRASGGALLGKTSTPDGGYTDSSEGTAFPSTKNPWDLAKNPGGSSSGAAASVSARFSAIAHGSDGAGSIRIPSSLCGVVGFKPTLGLVPHAPALIYHDGRTHDGPITRTVRDAALMLDVIAGPSPRDPLSVVSPPASGYLGGLREGAVPEKLRIAVSADLGYGVTRPDVASGVLSAAQLLSGVGWDVEQRDPGWDDPGEIQRIWWGAAFAYMYKDVYASRPETLTPGLQGLVAEGLGYSGQELFDYSIARGTLHEKQRTFFESTDYLITPTMPITAWTRETYPEGIGGVPFPGGILARAYLCYVFNITGNPAITIPCGLDSDGLPIGLQVIGRLHDDLGVLRVAEVLEGLIGFEATSSITTRS